MKEKLIVCIGCESEYIVKEIYSENLIHYCVYCSEELDIDADVEEDEESE